MAARTASYDDLRQFRNEARKRVPAAAWKLPLDELDLPGRTHNLLLDNEIETVGDVLFNLELGDDVFLKMRSFGDKALEELKDAVTSYRKKLREMAPETVEEPVLEEEVPEASIPVVEEDLVAEPAPVLEVTEELVVSTEEEPQPEEEEEVEVFAAAIEALDKPKVPDLDDLSKSLVDAEPPVAPPATRPTKPTVTIVRPTPSPSDDRDDDSRKKQKKGKQLVFDENVGRTVVKRKRKSNRTQDWGDFNLEDFDEF